MPRLEGGSIPMPSSPMNVSSSHRTPWEVAPDSLPDGSLTDPVLARLLLSRFPADRIVQRIHDMIEATRRTSFDTYESDWRTVESGIRLYLEFTARHPAYALPVRLHHPWPARQTGRFLQSRRPLT